LTPVVSTLNGKAVFTAVDKPYTGWTIGGDMFEDGTPGVTVSNGTTDLATGTNVKWVDVHTMTFDIDLSTVPNGTYNIVVSNGCGSHKKGVGTGMLKVLKYIYVVGTPNIDVVTGNTTPTDIAIDPSSDQVAVSYSNFWRSWSNDYTTSSSAHDSWWDWMTNQHVTMAWWDATSTFMEYCHYISQYPTQSVCWSWADWTGYQSTNSYWQPGPGNEMKDIANLQGMNRLWGVYDWKTASGGPYACFMPSDGDNNFNYYFAGAPFYDGQGTTGVVMDNLRAIDLAPYSGSGLPNFYLLEYLPASNTGVVEEYQPTGAYQGVSFGEGLFYDPLDLTTDSAGNIFVLDIDSSGSPMVWAFDPAGTLIGWSEPCPPEKISGDALRIDAAVSKNPDEVHVLHSLGVTKFAM
jgi:hypothetical protein